MASGSRRLVRQLKRYSFCPPLQQDLSQNNQDDCIYILSTTEIVQWPSLRPSRDPTPQGAKQTHVDRQIVFVDVVVLHPSTSEAQDQALLIQCLSDDLVAGGRG